MRAMILAAGRGQRMGHLTKETPKPLLQVANRYLIEYSIEALVKAGICDIVINVAYHASKIIDILGNGSQYGVTIHYSKEEEALETGGGIVNALPLLGNDPFIVMSSDIISDYPLQQLPRLSKQLAHLVLVDNPSFHSEGDFYLKESSIQDHGEKKLTFGNIGIYHPALFSGYKPLKFPLNIIFRDAIKKGSITGEHYSGFWRNMGTPDDLKECEKGIPNKIF
jgi:MurNAc alpha-1-phosphate uridylyltransferase